jgi:hypothetical protein
VSSRKDFEKDLQELSHPQLPVDRFRQTLRRDLQAAQRRSGSPGWKLAFAAASASAATFAFLLLLFVLDPSVPSRLHASVLGDEPRPVDSTAGTEHGSIDLQNVSLGYFLDQTNASAQVDQEYLQRWYSDRARPIGVKSVEDEKILAIRQFELTNGERVVVLTELGSEGPQRNVQSVTASNSDY